MSDLENFVRQNRDAFDDKEPSEKVWWRVEETLPVRNKVSLWNSVVIWRAAAVIFMVMSGYLLIPKIKTNVIQSTNDVTLKDFNDVETFYVEQISEKVELIDDLQKHEGMEGFTHDFKQLEAMYAVLKEEMKIHPSKKVKEALILNLLVRIDLLNQQLHTLEQDSEKDNDSSERKAARS